MLTKSFHDLHMRMLEAKCVEDMFGDSFSEVEIIKALVSMKKEIDTNDLTADESESYTFSQTSELFHFYLDWLMEAIASGVYGKRVGYRSLIKFVVTEHKGQKLFKLEDSGEKTLYTKLIYALHFHGFHTDKVYFISSKGRRSDIEIDHQPRGETTTFEIWRPETKPEKELNAKLGGLSVDADKFEIGDTFVFEAWKYRSPQDFLLNFLYFSGVGETLDRAFEKGDGTLEGTNILEAGQESIVQVNKAFEEENVFVVLG